MINRIIPADENNLFSSLCEKYKGSVLRTASPIIGGLFCFSQKGIFR